MKRVDSRQYPERPIVGVGAVIVDAGKVVLVKRRYEPLAGQWSLPGGTLELGETLEAGAAREIREETGLHVEVGPIIEVFDRIMLDDERRVRYHFVLVDYLCRPVGGELQADSDVDDAVLVAPGSLGPYNLTDKARAVIARALALDREAQRSQPRSV
jgi:8-oxo-dGTP diphosphatase